MVRPDGKQLHLFGRLFQEFAIDSYVRIETERLRFCRFNQDKFRCQSIRGLGDAIAAGHGQESQIGRRVVLPSSFSGGPRYIRQLYQDAMAIVRAKGKPSLFITMTCNSEWPEIVAALDEHQHETGFDRCIAYFHLVILIQG